MAYRASSDGQCTWHALNEGDTKSLAEMKSGGHTHVPFTHA